MSDSIGDSVASRYCEAADNIEKAVNEHLFSNSTGAYMLFNGNTTINLSICIVQYAILSGIASASDAPSSARTVIEAMRSLATPFGPLSFSNTTRFLPIVSPYASGFHTWAAFEAGMDEEAISLMRTVWKNQTDVNNPWYTGMTWEFINGTSGEPHNAKQSSQADGGVDLPGSSLGMCWVFLLLRLGTLHGRVPTPWGTITAGWEDTGLNFDMHITAPVGTNGTVLIPGAAAKKVSINEVEVNTNGKPSLPENVAWAGAEGEAYRVNVTGGISSFTISAF